MTAAALTSTVLPAAVSAMGARFLAGTSRATVLGVFPTAVYLRGREHHHVLPLVTSDAVILPAAVRLAEPAARVDWGLQPGQEVSTGPRGLSWPAWQVAIVRQWRSRPVGPPAAAPSPDALASTGPVLGAAASSTALVQSAEGAARAALDGEDLDPLVRAMVGAGPGLTPSHDDALCGVLLLLCAAGRDLAHRRLRDAVRARWTRTTSLSASLLEAAGLGHAARPVTTLVTATTSGQQARVREALSPVLAIGHSSGADTVAGLAGAAQALAGTTAALAGPTAALAGPTAALAGPTAATGALADHSRDLPRTTGALP